MALLRSLVSGAAFLTAAVGQCPDGPLLPHASIQLVAHAKSSCSTVATEIRDRVAGKNGWIDPHNGGTYALEPFLEDSDANESSLTIHVSRRTGGSGWLHFTDKMTITLQDGKAGCAILGCSVLQVPSFFDISTNFCNLHDLWCGSEDGCKISTTDVGVTDEQVVSKSFGAGTEKAACKGTAALEETFEKHLNRIEDDDFDTLLNETLYCISEHCPMDPKTMQPSKVCIMENCGWSAASCLLHSHCRHGLECVGSCGKDLAGKESAEEFINFTGCLHKHCPTYPASKSCVALQCPSDTFKCWWDSDCSKAMSCASQCGNEAGLAAERNQTLRRNAVETTIV